MFKLVKQHKEMLDKYEEFQNQVSKEVPQEEEQ